MIAWKNKPLIPDHNRNADAEMVELGLEIRQIIELLENGTEVSKRKEGIIEKWCHRGRNIYIVAIEDYDDYWLIRHVGKIRATKDKLKILRGEHDA